MASAPASASRRWLRAARSGTARLLLGPRDTWLPALALVVPAVLWLALEGLAYPPSSPTRSATTRRSRSTPASRPRAASASARSPASTSTSLAPATSTRSPRSTCSWEERPGPWRAASLAWNLVFLLAFLRGASRLAPGTGPFLAALLLAVFLQSRGIGVLASSWNPHVAMLPFGVALLASGRLATGQGRALPLLVLAASLVLQCQVAWAVGVAVPSMVGLRWRSCPRRAGRSASPRWVPASPAAASPPRRSSPARCGRSPSSTSSPESIGTSTGWSPSSRARARRRPGPRPCGPAPRRWTCAATAWRRRARSRGAARNLGYDPRLPSAAGGGLVGRNDLDTIQAALVAVLLLAGGWLAARRQAPTAALAWVAAAGIAAVPVVVRYVPGRTFPSYLFMWAAMVTLVALLVPGTELLARVPGLRARRGLAAALLLAAARDAPRGCAAQPAAGRRPPRSALGRHRDPTRQIQAQAAADVPGRRFLRAGGPAPGPRPPSSA